MLNVLRLFSALALVCGTNAYTWGLDKTACDFYTPSHIGRNRSPPDGYYTLSSNRLMFSPGETIDIRVDGSSSKTSYKYTGILISVRKDGESVGEWKETLDFRHIACDSKQGSALAESDNFPKSLGEHILQWTAPDHCEYEEIYTVKATIVKSKREFLEDVNLSLTCVRPSLDKKHDSCARGYYAIPEGTITSFEPGTSNGWMNSNDTKLSWRQHSGETSSPGTGPEEAQDGEHYVYMEASFPARRNQKAILESPEGLAGCVCFRFWYHKYTDSQTKLVCNVNGKETPCIRSYSLTDSEKNSWINSWMTINEPGLIKIKMIGQKGTTFRGDIGLDNFIVTPGMCKEDRFDKEN